MKVHNKVHNAEGGAVNRAKRLAAVAVVLFGVALVLCAAGASDIGNFSLARSAIQGAVGLAAIVGGLAYLGARS